MDHLAHFTTEYFDEYNSKPYQTFTTQALELLYTAAEKKELRDSAKGILDLNSAYTILQMQNLRRFPAFRRQDQYEPTKLSYEGETALLRSSYLSGDSKSLSQLPTGFRRLSLQSAIQSFASGYKFNKVLDELYWTKSTPFIQRLRHDNTEIYYSSPSFKLSGGGMFDYHFMFGSNEQHGWARPVTVLPTKMTTEWSYEDFFHIKGRKFRKHRNNNCVAQNFVCGLDSKRSGKHGQSLLRKNGKLDFL